MKKSIFHISHTDIPRDPRIIKELKVLKNYFFNYNLFAIGIKKKSKFNNRINNLNNIKDLSVKLITKKIIFLPQFIIYFLNYLEFFLKCIFKIYNKNITIVHCHDFTALPIAYVVKFLFNCKLIYDAHEIESETNNLKFSIVIFILEKLIWKKVDLFIATSYSHLRWYHKKFGYKKNSIIIFNSPEISNKIKKRQNSLRKKLQIKKNELIFLYVGGLCRGRGIKIMLETFSNPQIKSNLVFLGYGELEKEIIYYSKKYKNIHLLKSVPHDSLVQFIKSANVGLNIIENVSVSDFYCLPNKFLEYAFANLFILSSNFPDMRKLIKLYSLGDYIAPTSNNLYNKIQFYEKNKNVLKLSKKNISSLGWTSQSKKLTSSYQRLLYHSFRLQRCN
jgi:glycosyltransferase involved in cell wall biosynthesis